MTLNLFLSAKLEELQKKNPRFSMRALAQKAGISPGRLNEIFHERRPLSEHYSSKISYGLNLSQEEQTTLKSFVSVRAKRLKFQVLKQQELAMITSWEPMAILNLMKTDDFDSSEQWIAKRLALPVERVRECLDLLQSLNRIKMKNGCWVRTPELLSTTTDIPCAAIMQAHSTRLQKAQEVLTKVPTTKRDYSTVIIPSNVEKIEEAKQLIKQFRHKIALLLEDGPKTEVYSLSIQLYPLTDVTEETESTEPTSAT